MSLRAVEKWAEALDEPPKAPVGRPRLSAERREYVYLAVAEEWHLQGVGAGERSVMHAFDGKLERTLVRESLSRLKADLRRRTRERLERNRHSIQVHCRDAVWSQDAQELARGIDLSTPMEPSLPGPGSQGDPSGSILELPNAPVASQLADNGRLDGIEDAGIVQAEMIRDVASGKTIDSTIGPPADAEEIMAQLEHTAAVRGAWPLVYVTDNGGPYRSNKLRDFLEARQVIHLFNEPRTPEHNPWVEHGHGEHQQEMMLGAWDAPPTVESLRRELEEATRILDHGRLRATRGWQTAHQYDLGLPAASGVVSRAVFYEAACQAIARAVEGLQPARERRRAKREAILATLQSFGLITRLRGGVPTPTTKCELIT